MNRPLPCRIFHSALSYPPKVSTAPKISTCAVANPENTYVLTNRALRYFLCRLDLDVVQIHKTTALLIKYSHLENLLDFFSFVFQNFSEQSNSLSRVRRLEYGSSRSFAIKGKAVILTEKSNQNEMAELTIYVIVHAS